MITLIFNLKFRLPGYISQIDKYISKFSTIIYSAKAINVGLCWEEMFLLDFFQEKLIMTSILLHRNIKKIWPKWCWINFHWDASSIQYKGIAKFCSMGHVLVWGKWNIFPPGVLKHFEPKFYKDFKLYQVFMYNFLY